MTRTQIYLTETEQTALRRLARAQHRKQSALIREAIDTYLIGAESAQRQTGIEACVGLWKDRKDLPDFAALRGEWDRDA